MDKPKSNYKGMGTGPIGKRLAQTKMPAPRILHAGGGRVASKIPKAYHPPSGWHRGPMRSHGTEPNPVTLAIKGAKASQGLGIAQEQMTAIEEQMKRLGLSIDEGLPMNEGGL